jgi:hypothetical protein
MPLLSLKPANQIQMGQSNVPGRDVWEDILHPASNTALNGFCLKYLPPLQFYEYLTGIAANCYSVHTLELEVSCMNAELLVALAFVIRDAFCVAYEHMLEIIYAIA